MTFLSDSGLSFGFPGLGLGRVNSRNLYFSIIHINFIIMFSVTIEIISHT